MLKEIDNYFAKQDEPAKSCLLALRAMILGYDESITEAWRYGMPFYLFKGRRFGYLWIDKTSKQPYLGIVDGMNIHHPQLILGKRVKMKIILFDPDKDLPLGTIHSILKAALSQLN